MNHSGSGSALPPSFVSLPSTTSDGPNTPVPTFYLLLAVPLRIFPTLFLGGVFMSGFDLMRRMAIEEAMTREEKSEINKELRKHEAFYDL